MDEGWQPGHRLPSEADLIARFGMAKGTIREAIRILEAQGLVASRTGPGGGVFVHRVSEGRAAALLGNYFYFVHPTIDDIYQIRAALEPELAAHLAGRLGEDELARLEAAIDDSAPPAEGAQDEAARHAASLRFHAVLAGMSDNPLLSFVIRFTAELLGEVTVTRGLHTPTDPALWDAGLSHQRRLVAALRAGDADTARAVMQAHMAIAHRLMRVREATPSRRFLRERRAE
ncbi:GntR family transcriptional regulator [Rhodobaculum claviforme]|uniref:GntR family transcriptional regulator n=2 Tax=Rhodobaculum claviforme TaxID=1549854 RepID=A0A934TJI8_9RHOB|nr:GntR family transcriptional regulator [Rhodobaculum claviforme]